MCGKILGNRLLRDVFFKKKSFLPYILYTFWLYSDYILTTFWLHSDYILTTSWLFLTISDYFWLTDWQTDWLGGGGFVREKLFCPKKRKHRKSCTTFRIGWREGDGGQTDDTRSTFWVNLKTLGYDGSNWLCGRSVASKLKVQEPDPF